MRKAASTTASRWFCGTVLLLSAAGAAPAQDAGPADYPDEVALREQLSEAVRLFDSPEQPSSVEKLDAIVRILHRKQSEGPLSPGEQELLVQTLEYRARALFNNGQLESASLDFRELLLLRPDYELRPGLVSPPTIRFFEELRRREVGRITVSSEPSGATVLLDGAELGTTDLSEAAAAVGEHSLAVRLAGYAPIEEPVTILSGKTLKLSYRLERTMASVVFLTDPQQVEILIDGQTVGLTREEAVAEVAARLPAGPPAPGVGALQVIDLAPGAHQLVYRKECYEAIEESLEIAAPEDYVKQLVTLERSYARLSLRSAPPEAKIYLNGEYRGETPAILTELCAGTYRLELKHSAGRYGADLRLERGERRDLEVELKPTIAFAGTLADAGVPPDDIVTVDARLREALGRLQRFSRTDLPAERAAKRFAMSAGSGGIEPRIHNILKDLSAGLEAELLVIAHLTPEPLRRAAELFLYLPAYETLERMRLELLDERAFQAGIARLDQERPLRRNRLGAGLVDAPFLGGLLVVDVESASPAGRAGLRARDVVASVDSDPARSLTELSAYLARLPLGETVRLGVRGPAGERRFDLNLAAEPALLPPNDSDLLYNVVLLQRRQQLGLGVEPADLPLVRLDLALGLIHFGRWAAAVEELHKVPLSESDELGGAIVHYYLGICLEQLGYRPEARAEYEAALSAPRARTQGQSGLPVQPLASLRLAALLRGDGGGG
ncbi:MAG TPA: PEGA domain-containing protein [Acidobacteriota bacterium]